MNRSINSDSNIREYINKIKGDLIIAQRKANYNEREAIKPKGIELFLAICLPFIYKFR